MKLLEFLDRAGQRRLERHRITPATPIDTRVIVGTLFFAGYYALVWRFMSVRGIPTENIVLVKDAMLILGPVIGAIGQALFRTDARDEIASRNTGEAFRASARQAEAVIASQTPNTSARVAADRVADAASSEAAQVNREIEP